MAIVKIVGLDRALKSYDEVKNYLGGIGIEYDLWASIDEVPPNKSQAQILEAYSTEISKLKAREGYTTADVIDIGPETPGLEDMLAKFNKEHWHDEDEVRFTISGRGIFHIHPKIGRVTSIEVSGGDLIRIPKLTNHWFDLCEDRHITAIRLFQNTTGWTPYYTKSGVDKKYQPLCLGPTYIRPGSMNIK